jgi:type VI secretion system lysozyme-related protein
LSHQPKSIQGLRAPLFDRLIDKAPEVQKEATPLRLYNRDAVIASVGRDLQRLLNTRRATPGLLRPSDATVLDYGIPSFTHLSSASNVDHRILADIIRQAIQIFEPRVQDIVVRFDRVPGSTRELSGSVSCALRLGTHLEPLTFPIVLGETEGEVRVLAAQSPDPQAPEIRHG